PISASRSSKDKALSKRPAGGSASPAGTKTSSTPHAISRAAMSARCASSRTKRADRGGATREPRAPGTPVRASGASTPLVGEAVPVTVRPGGTHWATSSATPPAGNTSYRGFSSSGAAFARPPRNTPPPITAAPRRHGRDHRPFQVISHETVVLLSGLSWFGGPG